MFVNFIFMVSYTSLFDYHGSKHRIRFLHEKKAKKNQKFPKHKCSIYMVIFLTKKYLHGY